MSNYVILFCGDALLTLLFLLKDNCAFPKKANFFLVLPRFQVNSSTASGKKFLSGITGILEGLGKEGIYILLGTGNQEYEDFLTEIASQFDNFVFLNGFGSEDCASALYANGDLFLMPSSYEPCGISQMLAMRDAQPCLVHKVGGLKDTVIDGVNGFVFEGDSIYEQVDNLVLSCRKAIELKLNHPTTWQEICQKAQKSRFLWKDSVSQYLENVYNQSIF